MLFEGDFLMKASP